MPLLLLALFSLFPFLATPACAATRFFQPEAGFTSAKDLPDGFRARARSIRFDRRDAFEGSVVHTDLDRMVFHLGNDLHILSRVSTLRRRLLFAEGGEITKDLLAETERALRGEEFLSDAIITVGPPDAGECDVVVTTFDQWTLAPVLSAQPMNVGAGDLFHGRWGRIADAEWLWSAGMFETNLAGTGTKVGGDIRHTLERDARELIFSNNNLTPQHLQASAYAAWLSDGDSLYLRIGKPLLSRTDKYTYSLVLTSVETSERVYFDANALDALPDTLAKKRAGAANVARLFDRVGTQDIMASAALSYGTDLKVNVGPTFHYKDHYNLGNLGGLDKADTSLLRYAPLPASAAAPEKRTDALLGASVGVYRYAYRSLRNFRNLKWNESVETGWRLSAGAALNQEWLGAGDHDFRFSQDGVYTAFPGDDWYVNTGYAWQSFLSPGGDLADGRSDFWWETSVREHPLTSTWLTGSWTGLFATPASTQLTLGELNGLSGYPSFYYAGQARLAATLEQRLYPEFEILTMVPAFAAYLSAGNTYATWRKADPGDLHYSIGLGLRLGRSKSTQKIVQHFNVNFPLGDKYLRGPLISIVARKSL